MSDTCRECDKPIAVNADLLRCAGGEECDGCPICEAFCWRNYHMGCPTPIDWRARCEAAETELREYRALDEHRRRSDEELIQRRQADLTAEDVEALRWARRDLTSMHTPYRTSDHDQYLRALAVLDKLLGGAK